MQVQHELEQYRNDALYFEEHRSELLGQYPDHWLAVYDNQVVARARELSDLLAQLDKRELPRARVFIEHLSTGDDLLIVPSR